MTVMDTEAPQGGDFSRLDQIALLGELQIAGNDILTHGSIAHAAAEGVCLPEEVKFLGNARDIDIFTAGTGGKLAVESAMYELGASSPAPLDAGLCGLLLRDGVGRIALHKDGVEVEIHDADGLLTESTKYEIVGGDGRMLRSFTPQGLLAVHSFEPGRRVTHMRTDRRFEQWCEDEKLTLPADVASSIEEFHRAFRAKYPHGRALRMVADVYANVIPESVRKHFRSTTHRIMETYAGRENLYK